MKQIFAWILAVIMIASLAACGGDKPASESGAPASQPASASTPAESSTPPESTAAPLDPTGIMGSKVVKLFSKATDGLHMVMKMEVEGQAMELEEYIKGTKTCAVMQVNGEQMYTITDGTDVYQVIPSEKMAMKMSVDPEAAGVDMSQYNYDEETAASFETGSEEFQGETYDYERAVEENVATTFYFAKGTDTLRFIVAEGSVVEIVSYDTNVPAGIFDIPADYEIMDMGDLSGLMGDLGGADMSGIDMSGVDLSGMDLSGVDLSGVDLSALGGLGG